MDPPLIRTPLGRNNARRSFRSMSTPILIPFGRAREIRCVEVSASFVVIITVQNPGEVTSWDSKAHIAAGTTMDEMAREDVLRLRIQLPGLVDYSRQSHRSNCDNALLSLFAEAVNTKGHTVERTITTRPDQLLRLPADGYGLCVRRHLSHFVERGKRCAFGWLVNMQQPPGRSTLEHVAKIRVSECSRTAASQEVPAAPLAARRSARQTASPKEILPPTDRCSSRRPPSRPCLLPDSANAKPDREPPHGILRNSRPRPVEDRPGNSRRHALPPADRPRPEWFGRQNRSASSPLEIGCILQRIPLAYAPALRLLKN